MNKTEWEEMIAQAKVRYDYIVSLFEEFGRTTSMKEGAKDLVQEIYDMGFEHGQKYVWAMRSGAFISDDDKNQDYWTVQTSNDENGNLIQKSYRYVDGKMVEERDGDIISETITGAVNVASE